MYRLLTISLLLILPAMILAKGKPRYRYYNNGNIKYEYIQQKNQTVRVTHYFKSGAVKSIGHFKKGHKHGLWQNFNEEGQQLTNAFFNNNKKDGYWTFYNQEGELSCSLFYKSNKILKVIQEPIAVR